LFFCAKTAKTVIHKKEGDESYFYRIAVAVEAIFILICSLLYLWQMGSSHFAKRIESNKEKRI
jgi:uncharacterized membrane protein